MALVLLVVVAALVTDLGLLSARIDRVDVRLHPGAGTTWVLLGLDSRAQLPSGTTSDTFGTPDEVPGARADVILIVHRDGDRTSVLSIPRDTVVATPQGPSRLALAWLGGPQTMVDALCGLGIPSDHLATVDLAGFAAIVDAAGGIDVQVDQPVRDPAASLELLTAGEQHVDGVTALAMVRSRHPQHLVDGEWIPATVDPDGRATAGGAVLGALARAVARSVWRPWRLQQVAWAGADALTVDADTSLADLAGLATADLGSPQVLPVTDPVGTSLPRYATADATAAIVAAGMGSCTVVS